jgi:hypothetical protein
LDGALLNFIEHNIGAYLSKAGLDEEVRYSSPAAFLILEARQNCNLDKMVWLFIVNCACNLLESISLIDSTWLLQIKTDRPEAASFAGHGYLHDKNSY